LFTRLLVFQSLVRVKIWRGFCYAGPSVVRALAGDKPEREKMLWDLLTYAPLASVFLVTALRMFFEKPNRPELVFLRFKSDQRDSQPK